MDFSMVILAGGKSSRMGKDKSNLRLGPDTFLDIQIQKGQDLGIRDILVSGYRGETCRAPVILDRLEGRGPLGGLEACLRKAAHEKVLVLGVDTPLVPAEELARLMRKAQRSGKPVTIMVHGGKEEPLIGVYDKTLADMMEEEVTQQKGSVFSFIRRVGYEICESSVSEGLFFNVNRPEDYERVKNLLSK